MRAHKHELYVYLEDSNKVKEYEKRISDLERQLAEADAKVLKFHDALIQEMQYNMRLKDKVDEYERRLDYAGR